MPLTVDQKIDLSFEAVRLTAAYPVGTYCRFWPGSRDGHYRCGTISSPWSVLPSGEIVVHVDGYSGCIAASHHVDGYSGCIAASHVEIVGFPPKQPDLEIEADHHGKLADQAIRYGPSVCEFFQQKAASAVEEWDGRDNADLLELLAGALGISLGQLVEEGAYRRRRLDGRK